MVFLHLTLEKSMEDCCNCATPCVVADIDFYVYLSFVFFRSVLVVGFLFKLFFEDFLHFLNGVRFFGCLVVSHARNPCET